MGPSGAERGQVGGRAGAGSGLLRDPRAVPGLCCRAMQAEGSSEAPVGSARRRGPEARAWKGGGVGPG